MDREKKKQVREGEAEGLLQSPQPCQVHFKNTKGEQQVLISQTKCL